MKLLPTKTQVEIQKYNVLIILLPFACATSTNPSAFNIKQYILLVNIVIKVIPIEF